MRRSLTPPASSPYRALAHHHAQHGTSQTGQQSRDSVSSVLRTFNVETNPTRPVRPSPLTASTIPDMPLDLVDRIRSFPLFMSAPDDFLAAIGAHLRPQIHCAHDHILTEGDEAKAMYWLVRGIVAVTSRDGEAVYAELKPGAFFGEIGVLMDMPRTATIVARTKCLLVVLKKEDLQAELPKYPDMEKAIRQEAQERLAILQKKRQEGAQISHLPQTSAAMLARDSVPGEVSTGDVGLITEGAVVNNKKRKSPSPGVVEDPAISGSALGSAYVNVRKTLKELPLFATLPSDILHFLGLSAQPKSYPPFTDIVRQGTPGNDIYFIVRGEAEVLQEPLSPTLKRTARTTYSRPRLKQGQYFGEVASLGLSEWRTATVRSVTDAECLMIPGDVLDELWRRCPPEIKSQVEETAKERFRSEDVEMNDVGLSVEQQTAPTLTFTVPSKPVSPTDEADTRRPSDPDPFLSVDMENLRSRRRNSLAPPTPQTDSNVIVNGIKVTPVTPAPPLLSLISIDDSPLPTKRARIVPNVGKERPAFPDTVWIAVFQQLDLLELIRLRIVCRKWRHLLTTSPELCTHINLGPFNRMVNDWSVTNILAPFIGGRPVEMDITNCFHITDEGFQALWKSCGKNVKIWRMRSVWDVSAAQILEMSECAKGLEEVDWSNCRKVGDNLLARVVGWVVPNPPPTVAKNVVIASSAKKPRRQQPTHRPPPSGGPPPNQLSPPPPGTVIGCPNLRRLNLSYCKHITDRSMAHLAAHASPRLQALSLTRCTSVTDAGFQTWAAYRFTSLTHLTLADCTYLSDASIVALVSAAKNLTHLDLSFCCALSDTATEVVSLGLPLLRELRMAFCGSAVSDASLGCVALHLNELRGLSVRGCVRVTGNGVENVLEGCSRLEWLDVSQCKNLGGWLVGGGMERWGYDERGQGGEAAQGAWAVEAGSAGARATMAQVQVRPQALAQGGLLRGGAKKAMPGIKPLGPGPVMRPVIPPKGAPVRRIRKPVRFVVEKGPGGLR
ncbi:RNI-like protein [Parathielavia appendiculata]|uniref:RNI-like protein n=1 Tax=Parathielavia appendiculata TaxID=2587402 RepID=A0AAN6Z988_9PEZI|nr:RNI-like protein [Parathielavia appendiculata]